MCVLGVLLPGVVTLRRFPRRRGVNGEDEQARAMARLASGCSGSRWCDERWRRADALDSARGSVHMPGMETQQIHRGRLIDHIQLVVADLGRSRRFYDAVLAAVGVPLGGEGPDFFWADELFVSTADSKAAAGKTTGRHHLAFQAGDREAVDRFHREAVAAGGEDNGAPGVRPYHPGYYAAFVLDPDGNNIEVVFHGPGKRSCADVTISF